MHQAWCRLPGSALWCLSTITDSIASGLHLAMLCLLALLVVHRCCDCVQKPQSAIDSSQEQTTIIGLYLMLGPWPLSAATSLDTAALQQGQACPAGSQADLAFSVMSGSAAASAARPDSATGLATSFVGRLNSDADKDSHQAAGVAS